MSDFSQLIPWGWNSRWSSAFLEFSHTFGEACRPARVIGRDGPLHRLQTERGPVWAQTTGRLRHEAQSHDLPLVGDWVAARWVGDDQAVIQAVLPRLTLFSRAYSEKSKSVATSQSALAANIDVLGIVTGLDANFNPRRAQRLATLARQGGILPLWLLSKADLPGAAEKIAMARKAAGTDAVLALSPLTGEGVSELEPWLRPGLTLALAGSSGVGKTTLVNRLLGGSDLATGEVRTLDSKGRHTTTSRHLYPLPSGALLMDTPGFRTVGLWADEDALDESFADVAELAHSCRFDDCRHEREPGCAVRAALESGELDAERWKGWQKQAREVRYLERQADPAAQRQERDRWKAIHQGARNFSKENRSRGV